MNWFIFSILAGLFFAGSRVISRMLLRAQGNAMAFTAITDFVAGLVLVPFIFINLHFPTHSMTWVYFIGIVVFAFLSDWLAFVSLKLLDVSLYQIVNQSRHIFILIGGAMFFVESITLVKVVAIVILVIGVVISSYEGRRLQINKGVIITVMSTFCAVVAFLFAKAAVSDFSETAAASFELMLIGLISFSFLGFSVKNITTELRIQKWWLIVSGLFFGGFEACLFLALKAGEASKVIPVSQSSLIFTVLAGTIILKERTRISQKMLGMLFCIIAITLLYIY